MESIDRLCNLVWANSEQGTKIVLHKNKNGAYLLTWTIQAMGQDILNVQFKVEQDLLGQDIQELASIISASSSLIDQMVGYAITNEHIGDVLGCVYKVIRCSIGSDKSVTIQWQTTNYGTLNSKIPNKCIHVVNSFDLNDRMAVVFRESWDLISEMCHELTGTYPEKSEDFFNLIEDSMPFD